MANLVSGYWTATSTTAQVALKPTGALPPPSLLLKRVVITNAHASTAISVTYTALDMNDDSSLGTVFVAYAPAATTTSIDLGPGIPLPRNAYLKATCSSGISTIYGTTVAELTTASGG